MATKPDSGAHCVYDLNYHIVFVVKYRRKAITGQISDEMRAIADRVAENQGATIVEWNHDTDHLHLLIRARPTTSLSQLISSMKSATSRITRRNHPEIKRMLWGKQFWSDGYYIATTGGAPLEVIKQYIQNQGKED